jgi:serine/threonine-protein kinase RsbW
VDSHSVRSDPASFSVRVPFAASSVALVRRDLDAWLRSRVQSPHLSDRIDDARLVVSELVGNAVRHAQPLSDGCLVVTWELDPRGLCISVTDGGSNTRPRLVEAAVSATSGRGMNIVSMLAERWWLDDDGDQTTVHTLLRLR